MTTPRAITALRLLSTVAIGTQFSTSLPDVSLRLGRAEKKVSQAGKGATAERSVLFYRCEARFIRLCPWLHHDVPRGHGILSRPDRVLCRSFLLWLPPWGLVSGEGYSWERCRPGARTRDSQRTARQREPRTAGPSHWCRATIWWRRHRRRSASGCVGFHRAACQTR
ncbi:hypothetical protein BD289DRAFT_187602 [Coniella lustricola]|uniref:Secreted protein n=1 Tax=Coniella lustricola TaxID=2025994 RepID=A0A2T2ZT11_9PEZI|nr:hypothetical protein BD289DRAFT_187602 [Coniella lustricola]